MELFVGMLGAEIPDAHRRVERYRTLTEAPDAGTKALVGAAAMDWAYADGRAEDCVRLALLALEGEQLLRMGRRAGRVPALQTLIAADRDEVMDLWDALMRTACRRGSLFLVSSIHHWRGYTLLRRGDLEDAERELGTAEDGFATYGYGRVAAAFLAGVFGPTLLERGDLDGARRIVAAAGTPELVGDGPRYWLGARGRLLLAEGRAQEAFDAAEALARAYPRVVNPAFDVRLALKAGALDRLGRRDEAIAAAGEELELARRWGAPGTLGRCLRMLGTLERDAGIGRLEEAVEITAGTPAKLEHAKALAALGSQIRRDRRPTEAREPLRRALELAEACGAGPLAEHARSELYATGARPRTTALRGVDALTASERRVAALAADGETNRGIAQTLFVTPKTVELHLSSAYRKLGIRSRRQLAAALAAGS